MRKPTQKNLAPAQTGLGKMALPIRHVAHRGRTIGEGRVGGREATSSRHKGSAGPGGAACLSMRGSRGTGGGRGPVSYTQLTLPTTPYV